MSKNAKKSLNSKWPTKLRFKLSSKKRCYIRYQSAVMPPYAVISAEPKTASMPTTKKSLQIFKPFGKHVRKPNPSTLKNPRETESSPTARKIKYHLLITWASNFPLKTS
jgi:hypothetical protein